MNTFLIIVIILATLAIVASYLGLIKTLIILAILLGITFIIIEGYINRKYPS